MNPPRLIMYHKHPTSARTRFLMLAYGGVCGFAALPPRAVLLPERGPPGKLAWHPLAVLRGAEMHLGLPRGDLAHEPAFRCAIRAGDDETQVLLARFTTIDPPFARAAAIDGAFIDLLQARPLPAIELRLLRCAYETILG